MSDERDYSPEVGRLMARERNFSDFSAEKRNRVRKRLEATLSLTTLGEAGEAAASASHASKLAWLKFAGSLALGSVLGASAHAGYVRWAEPSASVSRVESQAATASPPSAAPTPSSVAPRTMNVAELPSVSMSAHANRESAPSAPSAVLRDGRLDAERALLETARTALARGNPRLAIVSLERHAREFRSGQLGEERDSIIIQALVQVGDRGRAKEMADAFRARYPRSVFLPAIDEVVRDSP